MKSIYLTAVLLVSMMVGANASDHVSKRTQKNFEQLFEQTSNVTWVVKDNYTKAIFKQGEETLEAFFQLNGDFIGLGKRIEVYNLPQTILEKWHTKFSGYTISGVLYFEQELSNGYFVNMYNENEHLIVLFDAAGKSQIIQTSFK